MWIWGNWFPGSFLVVSVAVLGLAICSGHRRGDGLREIGVRIDNLVPAAKEAAAVTLPVAAAVLAVGSAVGTLRPDWRIVAVRLPWLIAWGFLQQFVLQGFVHRRVREIVQGDRIREIATAAIFASCHVPNIPLIAVTFVGGWVWAALFRRCPNLIGLAVSHGIGSAAVAIALGPELLHGMRVGRGYFTYVYIPPTIP